MSASLNFLLIRTLSYGLGERDVPLSGSYKCMEMVMKLGKFKGCVFFGKIQKRICDLRSMDSSNKGLFSRTTQTNKPRVACNLKKKKKSCLTGLFWRNSSMKMPPEKKIPQRLMKGVEKSIRSKVQIDYRGYFLDVGKVLTILLLSKTLLV